MTPDPGGILDRYIHPFSEFFPLKVQSLDQYEFSKDMSYLLRAVLRGDCHR